MHRHLRTLVPLSLGLMVALGACTGPETATAPPPGPEPGPEVELSGSAPQGGRLYDRWWQEVGVDQPPGDQPLWASQSTNTRTGGDTWRCKECHGWDYQGADGAYGSGSHFTGFPGVFGSSDLSDAELLAWLDGSANADHDFSAMGADSMADLVTFLQEGMVDVASIIDGETKAAMGGDVNAGSLLYGETCASCHGADGRLINFGDDEEPEYLGTIALDNPWEFIHKVRAGQPGTQMPSAIDLGWTLQQVMDVLTFAQTLPTEASVGGSVSEGGKLYDKWWTTVGLDTPAGDNPLWARQSTNERSGGDTWRCKECHGWDYAGADGAYGSGSHFTGFPGVFGAQDKSAEELRQMLSGEVDPDHDYSAMGPEALTDLITFLKEALVDLAPVIDATTKAPVTFDAEHGLELYSSACTACHGEDGRTLNFGDADDPEFVGTIAVDNPWEFVHKVRFGQPGEGMPASEDGGWTLQDVLDILGFAQTLPTE